MNGESVMEVAASPDTEIEDGLPYTHDGVNFDEIFLFLLAGVWYFFWRIYTFVPDSPIFFWTVYLAEIYGFISAVLHIFVTWRMTIRVPIPPVSGLKVDVFIPTYNEPVDLVRKTILAATHMDYPHETWVLDDGRRPEMAELAKRLGVISFSK
jgi:cellulose synthase (UDP-forming)